ncbi:MAG: sulfatase [Planctomycetota bacterium]
MNGLRWRSVAIFVALLPLLRGQGPRRPNVVVVLADDHACHAISAYGSRINRTPNIDRLAATGMRFDRAYVTNSICAPSRAVLLTGKYGHRNGQRTNGETFDGAQVTLPKLLRAAGYQTGLIGKWHLGSDPTGFDFWRILVGQGTYYNPRFQTADGVQTVPGYTTDLITDMALAWLRQRDRSRPFLLCVQHKAPHREWSPAIRHLGRYAGVDIPEPTTLFDDWQHRAVGAAQQTMSIRQHLTARDLKLAFARSLDSEQLAAFEAAYGPENERFRAAPPTGDARTRFNYQRYIKDYLRCVDAVDEGVGRLLDALAEEDLADDTIVVYASDQGFFLGDHGYYDKRWMYEESARFPLLVRWPGCVAPGSACSDLVSNVDLAPTLLAACGAAVPPQMQGESLLPLLRGRPPEAWRRSIYYHYYETGVHDVPPHYGVRTDRYKLIHYYTLGAWELFDLQRDPAELVDVSVEPAYAEVRAELLAELRRLQRQYGDDDPDAHPVPAETSMRPVRALDVPRTEVLRMARLGEPLVANPEPRAKVLTFGALCRAGAATKGVVLAQGGERFGYACYFDDGVPCVAVRERGRVFVARGERRRAEGEVLVAGILDGAGKLHLVIGGARVATVDASLLSRNPSEGLCLGRDVGSAVGDYDGEAAFDGGMRDVRIYYGELDAGELRAWSDG